MIQNAKDGLPLPPTGARPSFEEHVVAAEELTLDETTLSVKRAKLELDPP
jgi:hypothetical protein